MDKSTYDSIVNIIRSYKGLSKNCSALLAEKFSHISTDTLNSILSLEYQKRMKANHIKSSSLKNHYYETFNGHVRKGNSPGIILKMAENYDVAPCLISKLILQKYFEERGIDDDCATQNVNLYMRDTTLIPDMDLAYEVFLCTLYDDLYSPLVETMKHSLGQQYEIKLHREVAELGLAFRDEQHLRKFGYDKTPDVKLEVPVAIDGFVINWIESKALFGDEDAHNEYMRSQYLSYWNRFGPGLVIYWFGFLETISDSSDKRFIVRDHLPSNIIHITDI